MYFDSFLQVSKTGAFGILVNMVQSKVGYAHVREMDT